MARNEPQSYKLKIETSKFLDKLFYKYTHLPLGGKEIVCPYWMNNLKLGIFGPNGGKGTPEEIVEVTNEEAQKAGLNLNQLKGEEIIAFMRSKKIGIDCSGFTFWMLDTLDKEKGGKGIGVNIPGSVGRFLPSRANTAMLTDKKLSCPIAVKEVRPGDMIRLNKGRHVAIVTKVTREAGVVREIEYAHSSSRTETSGVHKDKITVVDQNKGLKEQEWNELSRNGQNYGQTYLFSDEGDGLKRLNFWN